MVRNIVGLIVEAGLGRFSVEKIRMIIEGLDRNAGYPTAPPQGLFLFRVFYDKLSLENFIKETDKEILTTTFNT
jgi:tRNA U38,U39,U40 pseudouridine synthase TruA